MPDTINIGTEKIVDESYFIESEVPLGNYIKSLPFKSLMELEKEDFITG